MSDRRGQKFGITRFLNKVWQLLVSPSPKINSIAKQRQARMFASIFLVLSIIVTLRVVNGIVVDSFDNAFPYLPFALVAAIILAYVLCRTRYYIVGVVQLMIYMSALIHIFVRIQMADEIIHRIGAFWVIVAVFLSGIIFPWWGTLIWGLISVIPLILVPKFSGQPTDTYLSTAAMVQITTWLVVFLNHFRQVQEKDRQQELINTNRELQDLSATLENRVSERTLELNERNQELNLAYMKLQTNQEALFVSEKMASIGRLTAGFVHEMNTPLAAVRVSLFELQILISEYAQSIGDETVSYEDHEEIAQEMDKIVSISERSIQRALSFINSVKSQTRRVDFQQQQKFNAAEVIEEALLLVDYIVVQAKCRVEFEQQGQNIEMVGSPGSLAQIFTNLMSNAIDASVSIDEALIVVDLSRTEKGLLLRVRDQGVGIPAEIRSKIFDPLFTTKPFGEGTGLGLSIVHDIVTKSFQGTIEVDSKVGVGTTFSIFLPYLEEMHP
jgi:signal transduction histidine kinase